MRALRRKGMGYEFLEDVAIADVAFTAWGRTPEELFTEAAKATTNVMVRDLKGVKKREKREIQVQAEAMDLLLFNFLQEVIYYKDAENLLLAYFRLKIEKKDEEYELTADSFGEVLDPRRHEQVVDVKAVTLHRFQVVQGPEEWTAFVILDI
jgi:SHS2 domain-containing protein